MFLMIRKLQGPPCLESRLASAIRSPLGLCSSLASLSWGSWLTVWDPRNLAAQHTKASSIIRELIAFLELINILSGLAVHTLAAFLLCSIGRELP
jgi:hypothetical protein